MSPPPIVCVIGKKKSGKTATVVGLVEEFVSRGRCVMTVKHGHDFRLDREHTDSWKHRNLGGASRVVLAGPEEFAVMGDWPESLEQPLESLAAAHLSDADIVIAEGYKGSELPKIEVYRRAAHKDPFYGSDQRADGAYLAVLTDVPDFEADVPVLDVDSADRFRRLADLVEAALFGE